MSLRIRRKSPVSVKLASTLIAIFALVVAPMYGVVESRVANAVEGATYTAVDLNGWTTDRTAPSGGSLLESYQGRDSLAMSLDASAASADSWHRYEGLKKSLGTSSTLRADVYVENAWATMDVSTGLWGVTREAGGDINAYPIVAYTASAGGWRVYNVNTGDWIDVSAAVNANSWNAIELAIDADDNTKLSVYINDVHVNTQTVSSAMTTFSDAIINSYNYGTNDYTVHWSNVQTGVVPQVTHVDAYYSYRADPTYTAIGVDFKTKNVTTANKIELRVNRADNTHYSIFAKQSVIDAINASNPSSTSGPIVIDGKRTSGSWTDQAGTWTGAALPLSVDVIITLDDGEEITLRDETISENKAPKTKVIPSDVSNVVLNGKSVDVARAYNCGPTNFNHVRGNIDLSADVTDISDVKNVQYKIRKVTDGGCTQTGIYQSGTVSMSNQGGNTWVTLPGTELSTSDMSDGTYTIQMTVTDKDNNETTKYIDIVVDNSAPQVSGVTISPMAAGSLIGGEVKVSFTMTDSSEINMSKSLTHVRFTNGVDSNGGVVSSGTYAVQRVGDTNQYFAIVDTRDFVPTGTSADKFRVYIRTEDKVGAGNQAGVAFYKNQINIDNILPSVDIVDAYLANENTIEFTGSVYDENFSHYYCWLTGVTGGEVGGRGANCVTTWASDLQRNGNPATGLTTGTDGVVVLGQLDITGLADGDYIIRMGAKDRAGNLDTSETFAFTVDRSAFNNGVGNEGGAGGGGVNNTDTSDTGTDPDEQANRNRSLLNQRSTGFTTPLGAQGGSVLGLGIDTGDEGANSPFNTFSQGSQSNVLGAEDENDNTGCFKLLGLCWYYWVPIIVVVAALITWWGVSRRGKQA